MQDLPRPEHLLAAVAAYLRQDAGPALARGPEPALAYHAKVAANMLDIAARQLRLGPAAEAAELARLRALPGLGDQAEVVQADLATLNQRLAQGLAEGRLDANTPALAEHLWRSTLDKLAVDQPRYATYREVMDDVLAEIGTETAKGPPAPAAPRT